MSLPTYNSIPILDWMPDWVDPSRQMQFVQAKNNLEGTAAGPGAFAWDAPHQTRPRTTRRLRYVLMSRAEMVAARQFVRDTAQGRRTSFWVPLWSQAVHLTTPMLSTDTTATIRRSRYSSLYAGAGLGREHIAIFPRVPATDQTLIPCKITGSVDNPSLGTETLTLNTAPGYAVTCDDLICFLLLCRLDTDAPLLQWAGMGCGVLDIPLIDIPAETP